MLIANGTTHDNTWGHTFHAHRPGQDPPIPSSRFAFCRQMSQDLLSSGLLLRTIGCRINTFTTSSFFDVFMASSRVLNSQNRTVSFNLQKIYSCSLSAQNNERNEDYYVAEYISFSLYSLYYVCSLLNYMVIRWDRETESTSFEVTTGITALYSL